MTLPRTMNFFWSGSRMTFMRYMTLHSFRRWNPNFRMVLWSPSYPCQKKTWHSEELDDEGYRGEDYLPRVDGLNVERRVWSPMFDGLCHSQASDLFEWHLMSTIGGIYCDMDVLWLQPIESVKKTIWSSDVLYCLEKDGGMFAIGLLGACPRCPMYQDIYLSAINNYDPTKYESAGITSVYLSTVKKHYTARAVLDHYKSKYPRLSFFGLPDVSFYPFNYLEYPAIFTSSADVPYRCVGLHWFGGGPISQRWNQLLTSRNYTDYDNVFTRCCRKIIEGRSL